MTQAVIESILSEERLFPPSSEFAQQAHIKSFSDYQKLYDYAKSEP